MSVTSLVRTEMAAAMAAALVLGLLLLALRPRDRASTRNALLLLGVCALAAIADGLVTSMGWREVAAIGADAASILVGVVLIRLATIFVFQVALPAARVDFPRIAEDLATAALIVGWGFAWLRLAGVDLASLVTTSAVITAVVAFSMQDTLGNVLGGVLLQFDRSIHVGDWLRIDDLSGRVREVRWRHTAIETRNGETVIVPNGWLMKNRFAIVGARGAPRPIWRRIVRINVDLSASPARVCRVLEEAIENAAIEHVARAPAASAVMLEIGPRHGGYALRYWLEDPAADDPTDSLVRIHALAALERAGMKLGAPYQEELAIHDDTAHRDAAAASERERRIAALAGVDLFAPLSPAERETLAQHLVYAPFAAGDVMTRRGAVAHWLYLLVSGEAEVSIDTPTGRERIAAIVAGSVFGEMGMMTGAPRAATVTACTDVVCYRLDKRGFESIIKGRPDVAEAMSRVLAIRHEQLQGRLAAAQHTVREPMRQTDILSRIRSFFGIEEEAGAAVRRS
jgi:small-conductance mechanosensitive channel/CRP-like cAMP-binding protein